MVGLATLRLLKIHHRLIVVMNSLVNLGVVGGMLARPALSFHLNEENLVNYTHHILSIFHLLLFLKFSSVIYFVILFFLLLFQHLLVLILNHLPRLK